MDSGIASMTATFSLYLKMMSASRPATSCSIKDEPRFHLGLPTVLWEVILFFSFIDSSSYNLEMCMFKGDLLCSFSSSIFRVWNSNRAEHDSQKNPYLNLVLAFLCSLSVYLLSETTYLAPVFPKSFTLQTDYCTKHNFITLIHRFWWNWIRF